MSMISICSSFDKARLKKNNQILQYKFSGFFFVLFGIFFNCCKKNLEEILLFKKKKSYFFLYSTDLHTALNLLLESFAITYGSNQISCAPKYIEIIHFISFLRTTHNNAYSQLQFHKIILSPN